MLRLTLRILHITPTYLPATRYGGPIYSVHGLCRAQAARGDEVHVLTTNVDGDDVSNVPLGVDVELDGVLIRYFPCGKGRRIYRSPQMKEALSRVISDFDVLHLHAAFLWPTLMAARMATERGAPYIYSPRGMLAPELVRAKSCLVKSLWIALFERRTIAQAAAIHATSAVERDGLLALGMTARRIFIAPNGVDPPELAAREAGPARVVSLGRINWKKGLDRLIVAFAKTAGAELVIAGNDEEELTPKLASLASELGVGACVRFLGPVGGEAKWRLLQSATIFALASHSENFGNAVLEAMACGVPVIVTPEVGLAASVKAYGAGVVADGAPEAFGVAMSELLADNERRQIMGAAGREAARLHFGWAAIAEQMNTLYESVQAA